MTITKTKTDYQIIAEEFGVTVGAVKQAMKRRHQFPNNRLVAAYGKMQQAKMKAATKAKMNAVKK